MPETMIGAENLDTLLLRYNTMLYRVAFTRTQNRTDAEDVVQETWLRYFRSRPRLEDEEHRKAWLLHVCINCANSLLSSSWRKRTAELDETLPSGEQPDDGLSAVMPVLATLPEKYRTVIHLFYYEDLSVRQIAKVTGASESAVKTQLHRARELLKEKLGGDYDDL